MTAQARAKNLELVYWIDDQLPEGILVDGPRLRQVLLNLVSNAVKFTPQGHVEIVVRPNRESPAGTITFRIRDTGIGISTDRIGRLFKAFSQVDASITRNFGGTGLGLAISQRLVALMGGEIKVTSTLGKGSDFEFTLSLTPAEVTTDESERESNGHLDLGLLNHKRILVVDDLAPNRRLVELILSRHGARVISVSSARAAHQELLTRSFDLALLDYMMPESSGMTLARELRADARHRAMPLILLTSVQPDLIENTAEVIDALLLKPVRSHPLLTLVVRTLSDRKPASAPEAIVNPAKATALSHDLRLAVVDDNQVNLKVIDAMLRSLGYSPLTFQNPEDLLARLLHEKIDVVFMDVQMPGIDGFEATRRLRTGMAGEANRSVHIIALTAGAMPEERAACLAAGMDDFMAKPVARKELIDRLAAAMAAVTASSRHA